MKRIVSVWLPFLATERLRRKAVARPDDGLPLVTAADGPVRRLTAVDPAAHALGLRPGCLVADARAMVPALRVAPDDPGAERALLDHLADWCRCYTPRSAVDGWKGGAGGEGGGLWLDISGCAHLRGGEAALLADLRVRLRRHGFDNRAGIADTAGAAWAWARFGEPGDPCLPSGGHRQILAGLPVAALRLPPVVVTGLARLGLKTVRALDAVPRAGMMARFGPCVGQRLDQAWGVEDELIDPRLPGAAHCIHRAFAEPIGRPADVAAGLLQMLDRLCADLEQARLGLRRLEVTAFRLDASRQCLAVGTSRPSREPRHLFRLLEEPLAGLDAGFGIEMLRLAAPVVEALDIRQSSMAAVSAPADGESLEHLLDRLGNRLGFDRLYGFAARQSHWPERAVRRVPAASPASADARWPAAPRPLRLLAPPETVDVVAPLPDAPPVLFRWRREIHRIASAEGPERLSGEWWRTSRPDRDYYRVEDEAGRRFWLYRDGSYRADGPAPRWYLHGIFP
ncbi:DUF6504 family protein [Telmatospirillum siberiense]|uniref:Nucleotidyltransferase n=1 Tax=Telmatospirillum siberiense TaxID=382514 RepID=A0A2N3PYD3_9PROT|nr:DUF6504 family protein [Telmatospirillum siberiense]PKU25381.1 hypothetical protein CWS72_07265 [Telmatospirillum siberiense]